MAAGPRGRATLTEMTASQARCILDYLATPPGSPADVDARQRLAQALSDSNDDDSDAAVDTLVRAATRANWLRHPARRKGSQT